MNKFEFELGDKVKHTISGLEGIVVCRSDHLHGCVRYGIVREGVDDKGKPHEPDWFDEAGLSLVDKSVHQRNTGNRAPGPYGDPPPRTDRR